jgi:hypothetical protein
MFRQAGIPVNAERFQQESRWRIDSAAFASAMKKPGREGG